MTTRSTMARQTSSPAMLTPSWNSFLTASAVPEPGNRSSYSAIMTSVVPPPMSIEATRMRLTPSSLGLPVKRDEVFHLALEALADLLVEVDHLRGERLVGKQERGERARARIEVGPQLGRYAEQVGGQYDCILHECIVHMLLGVTHPGWVGEHQVLERARGAFFADEAAVRVAADLGVRLE